MPNIQGAIYFSSKSFEKNPNGWNDSLRENYYRYPAVIPSMPWIDSTAITDPEVEAVEYYYRPDTTKLRSEKGYILKIHNKEITKKVKAFIIYTGNTNDSVITTNVMNQYHIFKIVPAIDKIVQYTVPDNLIGHSVMVSCVDFENNESNPVSVSWKL